MISLYHFEKLNFLTQLEQRSFQNEPVVVYDTAGPYHDDSYEVDINHGLQRFAMHGLKHVKTLNIMKVAVFNRLIMVFKRRS